MGHEVHVVTWGPADPEEIDNLFIHSIRPFRKMAGVPPAFCAAFYVLALLFEVAKLNKKVGGFDIIHSNSQFFTPLLITIGSKFLSSLRRIPHVVTLHHLDSNEYSVERLQSRKYRDGGFFSLKRKMSVIVEAKVVNEAHAIIVVSNFTAKKLKQTFRMFGKKIFIIPNGVVLPPLDSSKTGTWKKNGNLFLLTIGRMEPRKGIPVLIESFKVLSEKYDNVRLILVGRGMNKVADLQMRETVKNRIKTYDHLTNSDLRAIYNVCDIYVSASLLEGFGLTVLEAMAAGKPVVAANSGSIPEFVTDGSSGRLVRPNSPAAICEAVSFLIENERLRQEIGKYNQEYATSHFTWKTATIKTVEAYRASA